MSYNPLLKIRNGIKSMKDFVMVYQKKKGKDSSYALSLEDLLGGSNSSGLLYALLTTGQIGYSLGSSDLTLPTSGVNIQQFGDNSFTGAEGTYPVVTGGFVNSEGIAIYQGPSMLAKVDLSITVSGITSATTDPFVNFYVNGCWNQYEQNGIMAQKSYGGFINFHSSGVMQLLNNMPIEIIAKKGGGFDGLPSYDCIDYRARITITEISRVI